MSAVRSLVVLGACISFAGVLARTTRRAAALGDDPVPPPAEISSLVRLEVAVTGLEKPLDLACPPGERERLFVVEQTGRIRIVRSGKALERPFLDLSKRISKSATEDGSEQGLLGLAFHPGYASNGLLYVQFTDRRGEIRIVELRADPRDKDRADPATEREILFLKHPYANHNGGCLKFGPDGLLYAGMGDGGFRADPYGNGQNPKALLAKMLRFDVSARGAAAKPEIYALGLRNPWRFSFDRKTGDLYIGDVGQDKYEEVDVLAAKSPPGANFGWNIMEGFHKFKRARGAPARNLVPPVVEYDHEAGCSVIGGFVYRGRELPELAGCYFYADYCTALIRSFRWKEGRAVDGWEWRPALDPDSRLSQISSFGEDDAGELYLISLTGTVYRFARAPTLK